MEQIVFVDRMPLLMSNHRCRKWVWLCLKRRSYKAAGSLQASSDVLLSGFTSL